MFNSTLFMSMSFIGQNHLSKWIKKILLTVGCLLCCTPHLVAFAAPKTILVLGDSLSAEYGLARGSGWVSLLEQRLQQKKLAFHVINASISGDTTSDGLARLPNLLNKYQPHIVIVELGGNDALRGLDLKASETYLRHIISTAQQAHAHVLLVGMRISPNYGPTYTKVFEAMYAKIAQTTGVAFVPFLLAGIASREDLFQNDRIHPTAAAHPYILDNIWTPLRSLISKSGV